MPFSAKIMPADASSQSDRGTNKETNSLYGSGGGLEKRSLPVDPAERASTRDPSKTATSVAASQFGATSDSQTRLSELANIDLQFHHPFIKKWIHSKISLRLALILLVPVAALIVLLTILLSTEVSRSVGSNQIVTLSFLVDDLTNVLRELSTEHTDSLWFVLDPTLRSGINLTSGGMTGHGLLGKYTLLDTQIGLLVEIYSANGIRAVSARLANLLAVIVATLQTVNDLRDDVQHFRVTKADIDNFYGSLIDQILNAVDMTTILADSATIQTAQALATWVRAKTAQERERHVIGQVLLLKQFSIGLFGEFLDQKMNEQHWLNRYKAIAPTEWAADMRTYFDSPDARVVDELRMLISESFDPADNSSLPPFNFSAWMGATTTVNVYYKKVRANLSARVREITTNTQTRSTTALSLYVLLAVLAAVLSTLIALLVGWSIDAPWNAMLRMKAKMFDKLHQEEQRNVIVDQFVPGEFFNMMGLHSIFDVQLGLCMLKRATIVCAVIRNFNTLSERMAPQQNFQFLSMWLQDNGPIIRRHTGFLEKFRGDGLTAIFHDPNDALDAALEMLEVARARNQDASNMSMQIESGLAIHTGDLMMGTVGDQQRMDTAIISSALATSLQMGRLTSVYRASLLVSRETFLVLNTEGLAVRFLGEAKPQDSHTTCQVYEVVLSSDEDKLNSLNEYTQAIKFHQEGKYDEAIQLYEYVVEQNPTDIAAKRRLALAHNKEFIDTL